MSIRYSKMEAKGQSFQTNVPLYLRIASDLMATIKASEPHTLLPSEPELVKKYGVSRGTVKQALDELEHQSFIYRKRGLGTYVAEPRILRHSRTVPSFSEDIRRRGHQPSIKLISLEKEPPSARVCTALSLQPQSLVWKVKRVFLSDHVPLALVSSYLPVSSVENLATVDVEYSLYAALERRYNLRPTWASDSYTAVRAQGEVVEQLAVNAGDPVIYSERIAYLRDMRVIEFVESYIRGDRFAVLLDWLPENSDSDSLWSRLNSSDTEGGGAG
jgi:GntR family transcriptional regulator